MRAGEMNKKITIQYAAKSKNSFKEEIITWTTLCTIWCAIEPTTGSERYLQQERISETTARFKIRYRSDIDTTKRIKYGNRYFDIISVINRDEANKELILMAKEVL